MAGTTTDRPQFTNPVIRWFDERLPLFSYTREHLIDYPTPRNLSYWWNFGSLAGLILVLQIATGVVLAMHYTAHVDHAFDSVERIMRDVNWGWFLRYAHANGASMFFIAMYIHMARGLYYGSYKSPREILWGIGVIIFLLAMATAFMGYVLPWGQMSFWGATVITNLFSAVPIFGEGIVTWLWGGFAVDNPTLNRFFSLHYLLPFLIVGAIILHLAALHTHGSNNPLGIDRTSAEDSIPFHPYYTVKDAFGYALFFIFFGAFVFFSPNLLGHPDNYIPADPLVTPSHIVPEWYFLPYYAILRAVPSKLGGVILMFASVLILFFLPWLDTSKVRSGRFRPIFKWLIWPFFACVVVLGWVGANPPEGIYVTSGRIATVYSFAHFLIILPLLGRFEKPLPLPASISKPILAEHEGRVGPERAPAE